MQTDLTRRLPALAGGRAGLLLADREISKGEPFPNSQTEEL